MFSFRIHQCSFFVHSKIIIHTCIRIVEIHYGRFKKNIVSTVIIGHNTFYLDFPERKLKIV